MKGRTLWEPFTAKITPSRYRRAEPCTYLRAQCLLPLIVIATLCVMSEPSCGDDGNTDVQSLIPFAEKGDVDAMRNLGVMYLEGRGVPQDYKLAVEWFRKAAEKGEAIAMINLGAMYAEGRGVPQDDKLAVEWFRKAAEKGNVNAMYNLGFMYQQGRGVPQDYKQAYAWFSVAAAGGMKEAGAMRDSLRKGMTPAQLAEGQRLSSEIFERIKSNVGGIMGTVYRETFTKPLPVWDAMGTRARIAANSQSSVAG